MTDSPIQRTFQFKRRLGEGTFGEVYEAVLQSPGGLEKRVAIKLLKAEVAHDREAIARLRDEGRILSNLDHPNILAVVDLVDIGARRGLVMEFVDGEDLGNLLRRKDAPIPLRVFLEIGAQVARALDAAWSTCLPGSDVPARLIHRDVKPQNIRVSKHGIVKLLDFGIARSDDVDREARTETAVVVGSVPFMAPEAFLQEAPGHPIDVFALGCVLFEALAGERFYRGVKRQRVFQLLADPAGFEAHREERIVRVGGPREIVALVHSCLAWEPDERPSAIDLARALERHAAAMQGPTLVQWCRTHTWADGADSGEPGELEGVSFTEGSLAAGARPVRPVASGNNPAWLGALAAVGVFALACGAVGFGLLLGARPQAVGSLGQLSVEPPAPVEVAAIEEPEPTPEPVELPPPAPAVAPPPVPVPVDPAPVPKPVVPRPPPPPPPEPAPEPPAPLPAPPTSIEVFFQNRDGLKFAADQDLLPGTYRIMANFGEGFKRVGSAEVLPGQAIQLACNPIRQTCTVK